MNGGQPVRYTWGLCYKSFDHTVAMYNLSKEEAERIAAASGGELVVRPISTRKYIPGQRGLKGSQVHAVC